MDLIIVESPSKAKTISKYLKGKYRVEASGGHVRDLPEHTMAVRMSDYEPRYEVPENKKETIAKLSQEAKKAGKVYLATDPDREGEAISWHLQCVLGLDPEAEDRIEFNEISQRAVEKALEHPRKINPNLVDAQQARRVLDRLVGYTLSPLLNTKIFSGGAYLSAGRVQSVALRLIVDREREIEAFVPEKYWGYTAELFAGSDKKNSFKATYLLKRPGENVEAEEAEELFGRLKKATYIVKKVKKGTQRQHAPAPFTTSSLQQDAANKLGMSSSETMKLAQQLYEGMDVGNDHIALITYLRTDSVRVSDEARADAAEFIKKNYGREYCPEKSNIYSTKKNIQDAHEAIRPISLEKTPASLQGLIGKRHLALYKLIYDRFLASQMSEAVYDTMQVDVEAEGCVFKASGRVAKFRGYTAAYTDEGPDDEEGDEKKLFPDMKEGDELGLLGLTKDEKATQPPKRYTDASLVKTMDEKGIGRPSTYASVISSLFQRKYVVREGKSMVPTETAFSVTDMLTRNFDDIMDINFTARMEEDLDKIEEGGTEWKALIGGFYPGFKERVDAAKKEGEELTDIKCEKCGSPMIRKVGKYGTYLACSAYPKCSNTVSEEKDEKSGTLCPRCGEMMLIRGGRYGKYKLCPNPDCKQTLPLDAVIDEGEKCEACGGIVVIKSGRYGKYRECLDCKARSPLRAPAAADAGDDETGGANAAGTCPECGRPMRYMRSKKGRTYLGCTGYPECKFLSWDPPTGDKCPLCQSPLVTRGGRVCCSDRKCKYTVN
ncbi:MAG: type I DNA topoisomerase [Clostridia bacterium]|nr:type I DNA topoisomerase [Clostridia bacterium]